MLTYIDCGSGVAGDMLLGALIGLGLSTKELEKILTSVIPVRGWSIKATAVERRMWPAWSVKVIKDRPFTSPDKMIEVIQSSNLPVVVRQNALAILRSLKEAERRAHGHFHGHFDPKGLGRIDTLVDVIGSAWGFWRLRVENVSASPLNTGRISPATSYLLSRAKVPIFSDTSAQELVTPTGAAILTQMVRRFQSMPPLLLMKSGYGAGTLKRDGKPNVLAIYQGKSSRKVLKYQLLKRYAHTS